MVVACSACKSSYLWPKEGQKATGSMRICDFMHRLRDFSLVVVILSCVGVETKPMFTTLSQLIQKIASY